MNAHVYTCTPGAYQACTIIPLLSSTALSSQIKVADRPVTQQGLGGIKTGSKGQLQQNDTQEATCTIATAINHTPTIMGGATHT